MKNQRTFTAILTGTIFAMAMLLMTVSADAQVQLRYQTRYSKSDVSRIITRLENSSDKFRRDFDKAMDNSRRNGSNAEDRYNDNVRDYENSLDALRSDFNRTNSWWETRNQTSNVIREAQVVNNMMNAISFRRKLENQWNTMRNDLNTLADTYDLPGLNGGGWNGGNNGGGNNGGGWNGGNNGNVPNWAVGTFFARNPENGGTISMTIDRSGRVTLLYDGANPTYATVNGTTLTSGQYTSKLSRLNNGVRARSTYGNQTIDYYTNYNGGGNDNGNGNGAGGNVPNWARGTFYARNPQNNGTITMTIDDSGSVTLLYDGATPTYATVNGTTLTNGPYVSRLSKINNGVRATDTANGSSIDYYRNR